LTRWTALPLLLAAALVPLAAGAQELADKVRLDDLALPGGPVDAQMEQVQPNRRALPGAQPNDRRIIVPAPSMRPTGPLAQVGSRGGASPVTQIAPRERSASGAPNLSQRSESPPGATVVLTGQDRCDPESRATRKLSATEAARCRHTIERRAGEFHAPQPPMLSAEQRLLIDQQAREGRVPVYRETPERMARVANDPNSPANQEVAAVVLGTALNQPTTGSQKPADSDKTPPQGSLAEVIQSALQGVTVTPAQ
jgi:hypothetical protein